MIHGWVRDTTRREPCHLRITLDGETIAEAVANQFRPDLLQAGFGHGYFSFQARLRHLPPPGPSQVLFHLPHLGASAPMRLDIPFLTQPSPIHVEHLLVEPPGWTPQDLLAAPNCLDMDADHARLGTPRFLDAVFRFVFSRWPTEAETKLNTNSLAASRITPAALLRECLASRERADMDRNLPSPYDRMFPFLLPTDPPASP